MAFKTPGVYVKEISSLPPSVAQVETAIPAFIGYTMKKNHKGKELKNNPVRISSLKEFEEIFGITEGIVFENNGSKIELKEEDEEVKLADEINDPYEKLNSRLYYALRMFYGNGGGACYIISCGSADEIPSGSDKKNAHNDALDKLKKEDEPTMIVMPELPGMDQGDFYGVYKEALKQCGELKNRVVLIDLYVPEVEEGEKDFEDVADDFRSAIGNNHLKYGIAYYPWLETSMNYMYDEASLEITFDGTTPPEFDQSDPIYLRKEEEDVDDNTKDSLYHVDGELYNEIKKQIDDYKVILPPSAAMAGVYAFVDRTRGVWKAPANVSLNMVRNPMVKIDDEEQRSMNVHTTGKSVNAIREFTGKGILVWGARTLAGNDNEWRYVPVRRFYIMVEESVKKATTPFVFEPNDATTWKRVRAMIENFLTLQWRDGALQGAIPDEAFFVSVGLGETMTAQDILEGRMIVEIGMAVVRPAEFIILRFSHKMAEA